MIRVGGYPLLLYVLSLIHISLEENKKVSLSFDFMPELSSEEKGNLFLSLAQNNKKKSMLSFLKGLFPAKLCPCLLYTSRCV